MWNRKLITVGAAALGLLYVAASHAIAGLIYIKDTWKTDGRIFKVRAYTPEYRKRMEEICIATASDKARTDAVHGEFTKKMYCDLYLDHGIGMMLVDETEQAVGYVLAAKDIGTFLQKSKEDRKAITDLGEYYAKRAEAEWDGYLQYAEDYPAHLHIDILEDYTGHGNGSHLMQDMLKELKTQGVKGVMLGVAKSNPRAVAFYQKNGFTVLEESEGGYAMGIRLQEEK